MRVALLLLVDFCLTANAADWYCRPPVISGVGGGGVPTPVAGVYGSQNGTSYANAWNGLRSVVWGGGGVQAGDTLWVCGAHVHWINSGWFDSGHTTVGASGTVESPITIRGDYPGDSGDVYGIATDLRRPWEGPDGNGVFYQQEGGAVSSVYSTWLETDGPPTAGGTVYVLTNKTPDITWTGGSGATFVNSSGNTTNFIKPNFLVGGAVSTNVFMEDYGYYFDLASSSNIVFSGLKFTKSKPVATISVDGSETANHISFTNCTFRLHDVMWVYTGWNDWTWDHCTFTDCANGVYGRTDAKAGPHRMTVRNCTFYNIGAGRQAFILDGRLMHDDSHSVGMQGGVGHVIEHNDIQRSGEAISFWSSYQVSTNHIVRYNFIKDIYVAANTGGGGIVFSGENCPTGNRVGSMVYGNILVNLNLPSADDDWQAAIQSNNQDAISIFNNTISNANVCIRMAPLDSQPVSGMIENNIILSPVRLNMKLAGTGAATATVDYNLFYPSPNSSDKFSLSPSFTHDTHSVFGQDVLFTGGSDANYYRLQSVSPARGAGTAISGYTIDRSGHTVASPPSIGAFEYFGNTGVSTTFRAVNLKGR